MIKNVNQWVQNDSKTAKWYKKVTGFEPPAIDKHTPRQLSVIVHRLRLGYRANWEIITNTNRPCAHCDTGTDTPLLNYLLQCTHTHTLRNTNTPDDLHSDEAIDIACDIAKSITQDLHAHADTLLAYPPPR